MDKSSCASASLRGKIGQIELRLCVVARDTLKDLKKLCEIFTDYQLFIQLYFRNLWEILGNLAPKKLPLRPAKKKAGI